MSKKFLNIMRKVRTAFTDPGAILEYLRIHASLVKYTAKDPQAWNIAKWGYGKAPRCHPLDLFPGLRDVDVTIVRAYDRVADTSIFPEEVFVLCSIVQHLNPKNILEIGTFNGNTTLNLAVNSSKDTKITTVDLPTDWDGSLGIHVPKDLINVTDRTIVGEQFHGTPHEHKIRQVFGDSAKIDWNTLSPPFDFIFIDGCHYYEYVKQDTINAIKHLTTGGVIVWHDYGIMRDVSRAVDSFSKQLDIKTISGTRLAVGRDPGCC